MLDILNFFPNKIAYLIKQNFSDNSARELVLSYRPNQEEILEILQRLCDNSIYSYQNQICGRIYYG